MVGSLAVAARPQPFVWPSVRPHLSGLVYDEETRDHTFHGQRIQSVTQILTVAGKSKGFDKVRPQVLAFAGRRGTAVHLAAQLYMEGVLDETSIAPEIAGYCAAVKALCDQRKLQLIKSEAVIFSKDYGYTGRADFIGLVDRRQLAVLDFATGDPAAARKDLQITAYDTALTEEFEQFAGKVLRWSVQLFPSGKYRLTPHNEFASLKSEFLAALADTRVLMGTAWRRPPMTNNATMPEPLPESLDEPMPDPLPDPEPDDMPEPMPDPDEEPASTGQMTPVGGLAKTFAIGGPAFEEPEGAPLVRPHLERPEFMAAHEAAKAMLVEPSAEPEPDEPVALALNDVPKAPIDIIRRVVAQIPNPPEAITDPTQFSADRDLIVALAARLACEVCDQASAQLAKDYAAVCDQWARAFHAYHDPRVAKRHDIWKEGCGDRERDCGPFEQAKEVLIGKEGAVNVWIRNETERKEREAREEQRKRDEEARVKREAEEAERRRAEDERRKAAAAAEQARLEQERQRKAAEDARRQGDVKAAAEAKRLADEAAERERAEKERAAEASRQAQAAEERRDNTIAETVKPDTSTTKLAGATGRANWTYELRLEGKNRNEALLELVIGIATRDVLTRFIEKVRAIDGWENSPASEILNLAFFEAENAPEIPVMAVDENSTYLRTRAKADKDTLKWPGVRFYNAGSTALGDRR